MPEEGSVTISLDRIKELMIEKLPEMIEKELFDGYSSPIKKAVEQAVTEQEGPLKLLINGILSDLLTKDEFRVKLGEAVLNKVIQQGLRN